MREHRTGYAAQGFILGVLLAAVIVIGCAKAEPFTSEGTGAERVCYPAKLWGPAPTTARPCVTVARLYEDGSGRLELAPASGQRPATCVMPNPREEVGGFEIYCYRR